VGALESLGPNLAFASGATGGVNFWASFSLDPGNGLVSESDLRWLQRVTFSKAVPGFPSPNRAFIDPRAGQSLGQGAGDGLPWYDVTGPSKGALSLTGGGDDRWMGDGPFAPFDFAPLAFSAETLVVAIDAFAKTAVILGGVAWGYAISAEEGGRTTASGPFALGDSTSLRAAFNDALAADFPEWVLVAVPEPSSARLGLAALAILARARRGRRAHGFFPRRP
jgi:hypothetical protein